MDSPATTTLAEGLALNLPPHLTENFEKADKQLRELYGVAPGVTALLRLWLACATSSHIRREFEYAVLEIKNPTNLGGDFLEDESPL